MISTCECSYTYGLILSQPAYFVDKTGQLFHMTGFGLSHHNELIFKRNRE